MLVRPDRIHDARAPSRDPTGTARLRRRFKSEFDRRWRRVKNLVRQAVVDQNLFGLVGPNSMATLSGSDVQSFGTWLSSIAEQLVLGDGQWAADNVRAAYNQGMARAMKMAQAQPGEIYASHMEALANLTIAEIQGVVDATVQQATRVFTAALISKQSPNTVARLVADRIDKIGVNRSRIVVDVSVVQAHAEATLDTFKMAGVRQVGTIPEAFHSHDHLITDAYLTGPGSRSRKTEGGPSRSTINRIRKVQRRLESLGRVNVATAGDDKVCSICEDIEQAGPYSIDEARGLIPAHGRCRCAFVPVDEEDE